MRFFFKKKLDFFIVGAQKSGTSALDYYLRQHSQIEMPHKRKELHFFDNENNFSSKKVNYYNLEKHFLFKKNKIRGEVTPIYMYWGNCISRIKKYNSKSKIIVILRNPIERAYSQYNMEMHKGKESEDFYYCVSQEEERIAELKLNTKQHRVFSYKTRGLYFKQMQKIYQEFPKDQVLVIKYEKFQENYMCILNQIFRFLGVKTGDINNYKEKQIYKIPYRTEMDARSKKYLLEYYLNDIESLERLLDWDCKDWKSYD